MADEHNSWQEAVEDILTLKHQHWVPIQMLETQPKGLLVNPDTKDRLHLVSTASSTAPPRRCYVSSASPLSAHQTQVDI